MGFWVCCWVWRGISKNMVNQKGIISPHFLYHFHILSFSLILIPIFFPNTRLTLISNSASKSISIPTRLRQLSLQQYGSVIFAIVSISSSTIFWLFFFYFVSSLALLFTSFFEEVFGFLWVRLPLVLEFSSNNKPFAGTY